MSTLKEPEQQPALVVERALKSDGGERYTLDFDPSHAALIVAAAATVGLDPVSWILRIVGNAIADQAGLDTQQPQPIDPSTVN